MAPKEKLRHQRSISAMIGSSRSYFLRMGLTIALFATVLWMVRIQIATPNDLSKPILLLGLPKSGSEAIHEFLQCMGVASRHYCCDNNDDAGQTRFPCRQQTCGACVHANLQRSRDHAKSPDPFTECGPLSSVRPIVYSQFDVESEEPFSWFLPQHFALPLLEKHSGLWILNTREKSSDWATHILHWHSITKRLFRAFDLSYYSDSSLQTAKTVVAPTKELSVEFLERELDRSLARAKNVTEHERRKTLLAKTYEQHSKFVRDFAQHHQRTVLSIEVDGEPKEISRTLAKALHMDPNEASRCWQFDPIRYGDDWRDFELRL